MTATGIHFETVFLSNPAYANVNISGTKVDSSISYQLFLNSNITTLSLNLNSIGNLGSPSGILYVPTLIVSDACNNASAPYIPQNATRIRNLPASNPPKIAIAPWVSQQCVQHYLGAAQADQVQSFIFFLPNRSDAAPPPANDPAWSLDDGGAWKGNNQYPVYAVSTDTGEALMNQLELYSGNMSSVPFGSKLETLYEPHGYIRIGAIVSLNLTSGLPSLWVFLVIIVVVLIVVVTIISIIMHLLQQHRRRNLRRRVERGEVDLEMIGVKRLMVPKEVLEKMPTYMYEKSVPLPTAASPASTGPLPSPEIPSLEHGTADVEKQTAAAPPRTRSATLNQFDQPTCAICLDDFVPAESRVRQLPCDHIFHPECVDVFLTQNSSLCPLCKKTCLPPGFCPSVITNAMVRRERMIRRARLQAARAGAEGEAPEENVQRRSLRTLMTRRDTQGIPMQSRTPGSPEVERVSGSPAQSHPAQGEARREWVRRRIDSLVGPGAAPRDPEQEELARPMWSRALRRVFPTATASAQQPHTASRNEPV